MDLLWLIFLLAASNPFLAFLVGCSILLLWLTLMEVYYERSWPRSTIGYLGLGIGTVLIFGLGHC